MERNKDLNARGGSNNRPGSSTSKANVSNKTNKSTKQNASAPARGAASRGSTNLDEDKSLDTGRKNVKAPASTGRSNKSNDGGARSGSGRGTGRTSR